jgi:hypothetical protein
MTRKKTYASQVRKRVRGCVRDGQAGRARNFEKSGIKYLARPAPCAEDIRDIKM